MYHLIHSNGKIAPIYLRLILSVKHFVTKHVGEVTEAVERDPVM